MGYLFVLIAAYFTMEVHAEKTDWLSPDKAAEIEKNLDQLRQLAKQAPILPSDEAIPRLAEGVEKTSHGRIYYVGEREEVHQELKKALIATPGHAKYYGDILLVKHANYKADIIGNTQHGRLMPYHDTAMRTFGLLKLLPSAETVEVLGEMLSEEWQDHDEQEYYEPSLGASAMMCLSNLPIVGKPPVDGKNALRGWQNWYAQIKEGRRTFRFEGDPHEYDLRGPANEALNPDIRRTTKRPSHQQAAIISENDRQSSSSYVPAITAIALAILIGGGYWVYRRKSVG